MLPPKIAIIGAGPAGMALARLLQINGIPCTIYEKDAHRTARDQGGSLDLHPNGGQMAIHEARLMDEFQRLARPESDCMKLLDRTGKILHDDNMNTKTRKADRFDRPEIDRVLLRDMFLDSLEPGTVHWGHEVKEITCLQSDDKRTAHAATFSNDTTIADIDLVVGADGAFSRIRPLVTDAKPFYAGITAITSTKADVAKEIPWLSEQIGAGSCFMFDEGRAVQCQRQGNGSVRVYTCVRQPLSWKKDCGIDWENPTTARKALVEDYFADCGEDIKRVILETDEELDIRHLWMLPVGLRWESKPSVTLLGDAAHLQTPFAGIGVNMALVDALELANALVQRKEDLEQGGSRCFGAIDAAIREYETSMFPRAKEGTKKSAAGLEGHFSSAGGQSFARKLKTRDLLRSSRGVLPL